MAHIFDEFVPAKAVWGRNKGERAGRRNEWHILGGQLPRFAPVSPTIICPCATILYSDGLESHRLTPGPGKVCAKCEEFARLHKPDSLSFT